MLTVRKTLSILAVLLLLTAPAWAMRTPMFGGSTQNLSASATRYEGFASAPVATNDLAVRGVASMSGTIEGLYVNLPAAPDNGAGTQSYAFTFQKNGADTSITCTASETSTNCSDTTHTVSLAAGDTFSVKIAPSGTPTVTSSQFSTIFNSGSGGGSFLYTSANSSAPSTSAGAAANVVGNIGWNQSGLQTLSPTNGTISSLYISLNIAPGAAASGKQYVFTVQKNGVDTSVTCTALETATTCNDTTHSFSFVSGDTIKVTSTPTGTPASTNPVVGLVMTPTIDGESIVGGAYAGGAYSNSVDNFQVLLGYWGAFNSSEPLKLAYIPNSSIVIKNLIVSCSNAPGAAKSVLNDVRINSSTSTTLTCTRTGTGSGSGKTFCTDTTHTYPVTIGDSLYFRWSPTGTPTTGSSNYASIVLFIDPTDKIYGSTLYDSTIN